MSLISDCVSQKQILVHIYEVVHVRTTGVVEVEGVDTLLKLLLVKWRVNLCLVKNLRNLLKIVHDEIFLLI